MGAINLICLVAGAAMIAAGSLRFRGPWARYRKLRAQEANIARYEGWRGNRLRDETPSAATLMAEEFRRKAQLAGLVVAAGAVLMLVGLVVR